MKYCPNPDCPYALRHREAQEYRDEALTCSDCGAELTSEPPAWPEAARPQGEVPWIRLALTLGVPLLVAWMGPQVPLPGLDREEIERRLGALAQEVNLSVFALGLSPLISAFLLVEVAALSVPRWRPLRVGGPQGRGQLARAAVLIGLSLAIIQGTGMAIYLSRMGAAETGHAGLLIVLTLVGGTFFLLAVSQLLDRMGFGGGYSLLITALGIGSAWPALRDADAASWGLGTPPGTVTPAQATVLCATLLAVVGTVVALRWRPRDAEGPPTGLPLPACGLLPLQWGASVALFVRQAESPPVASILTAALAVGFGFLFYRPSKVTAFLPNAVGPVTRAVVQSAAYVVGLGLLERLILQQPGVPSLSLIPLVMVVALSLDVIAEARAVRRHGALVPVWPEHRLYAVDAALQALDRAGIPNMARSRHQRALWHFFAPLVPIQILVPRARAEDAAKLLLERGQG